jgi:hypothetical protein
MSYIVENIPQEELDAFIASVGAGPQRQESDRISLMDLVNESLSRSQRWAIDRSVPAALFRWFSDSSGDRFAFFIKDKFDEFEGRRLGGVLPAILRFSVFRVPLVDADRVLVESELKKAFYIHGQFGRDQTSDPNCRFELITEIEFQYPRPERPCW